jgi:opacity protein-like surface antigen
MIGEKGQLSGEYLLLIGSLIAVLMISAFIIANENELNIAMAAAKSGVSEGVASSSSAIYPKETFKEYDNREGLKHPYSISIVNISYSSSGIDENYGKQKIQFKVYAKASQDYDKKELDSIGDRINYNLRKSIAMSFNTTNTTNKLYNPVFSNNYIFTTANVVWV